MLWLEKKLFEFYDNLEYFLDNMQEESKNYQKINSYYGESRENLELENGKLGDVAPTILDLMNLEKPVEMTGNSLIKK